MHQDHTKWHSYILKKILQVFSMSYLDLCSLALFQKHTTLGSLGYYCVKDGSNGEKFIMNRCVCK